MAGLQVSRSGVKVKNEMVLDPPFLSLSRPSSNWEEEEEGEKRKKKKKKKKKGQYQSCLFLVECVKGWRGEMGVGVGVGVGRVFLFVLFTQC